MEKQQTYRFRITFLEGENPQIERHKQGNNYYPLNTLIRTHNGYEFDVIDLRMAGILCVDAIEARRAFIKAELAKVKEERDRLDAIYGELSKPIDYLNPNLWIE